MKMTKERALIVRLANALNGTITQVLDDAEKKWDFSHDELNMLRQNLQKHNLMLNEALSFIKNGETGADESGRVYIHSPHHIFSLGFTQGAIAAQATLDKLIADYKLTGVGMAKVAVDGLVAESRLQMIQRNVRTASAAGFKLNEGALAMESDDNGYFLVMHPTSAEG